MRLKTFGMGAAGFLAAGSFAMATGTHSVAASCSGVVGTGTAPTATGVAVCSDPNVDGFHGGTVYVGVGNNGDTTYLTPQVPVGVYAVVDGDDSNSDPVSTATGGDDQGYIGVSNYESGSQGSGGQDAPCNSGTAGSGTNGGGSVGVDAFCSGPTGALVPEPIHSQGLPVPFVVCGHVSGNDWTNTVRDGCWEP